MLTLLFHVDLRYAIGASLVSVIATSSGAAAAYVREGYTNVRVGMLPRGRDDHRRARRRGARRPHPDERARGAVRARAALHGVPLVPAARRARLADDAATRGR